MATNPYTSPSVFTEAIAPRWVDTVFYLRLTSIFFCLFALGLKLSNPSLQLSNILFSAPVAVLLGSWVMLTLLLRAGQPALRFFAIGICSFILAAILLTTSYNLMEEGQTLSGILHQTLLSTTTLVGYGSAIVALLNSQKVYIYFTYSTQTLDRQGQELTWLAANTPPYQIMWLRLLAMSQLIISLHLCCWLLSGTSASEIIATIGLGLALLGYTLFVLTRVKQGALVNRGMAQRFCVASGICWACLASYCFTQQFYVLCGTCLLVSSVWFTLRGSLTSISCRAWFVGNQHSL